MKYGENITRISVPKWNIHNVDYNPLKNYIKANTKRDDSKAKAIAIPGQPDTARAQFEEQLFEDLCQEHHRVSLFVRTKSEELSRRLQHASNQIHHLALRCNQSSRASSRRYSKLLRYEQELLKIGDDINNLPRFASAQTEAFRKIIKKYRKWTGSSTLGDRFKHNVLADPHSFTHMELSHLKTQFENIVDDIRSILANVSSAVTPVDADGPTSSRRPSTSGNEATTIPHQGNRDQQRYWNEYEDGSEAGDAVYEIYVVAGEDDDMFPSWVTKPFTNISSWLTRKGLQQYDEEQLRAPLLNAETSSLSYAATAAGTPSQEDSDDDDKDDDDDEGVSSTDEFLGGYEPYYASLPSINDQKIEGFKNMALSRATLGLLLISSVLLIVAAILISTGRHKLMVEVDVGVTIGVATALACSFIGLAMFLVRTDRKETAEAAVVWTWFTIVCGGSGALLVQVADRLT
ncbi:uncharacterized protein MKZ38_010459 [Zalerion maritima]|uniref:SPX domain-containing protein n=1 Tax=Zalerion maritima TaxID=339359 RepID=A0AAD5RGB6_9PEZI|nr:uncharacterized protein MKZ38_010459 [Zalerion maritima]